MKFWDSSALLPLIVRHPATLRLAGVYREDSAQAVWWGTDIECISTVARMEHRGGFAEQTDIDDAHRRLEALRSAWHEVQPTEEVKRTAKRLLRVHSLPTADALQLAAALVTSEHRPQTLEFVCLDDALTHAARLEGLVCPQIDRQPPSR